MSGIEPPTPSLRNKHKPAFGLSGLVCVYIGCALIGLLVAVMVHRCTIGL